MKFPFPTIAAAFRERRIVRQPIPDVTEKDVERIVRRDFPREQYDTVMGVLREYSQGRLPRECSRVHLAALKLAQGHLERLRLHIGRADQDYRDVLAAAEYPEYMRVPAFRVSQLSRKEQLRIVNSDWNQYAKWLQK
jgi:hypothetical protein